MKVILDTELLDQLWDKMLGEYHFSPRWNPDKSPFSFPHSYELYRLGEGCWSQEQETRINKIFETLVPEDGFLYARIRFFLSIWFYWISCLWIGIFCKPRYRDSCSKRSVSSSPHKYSSLRHGCPSMPKDQSAAMKKW